MKSEAADSMVNGQVGLMMSQSVWRILGPQKILANVEMSGVSSHQLEFCRTSSGRLLSYRLLGPSGHEIDEWKFTSSWGTRTLDINGGRGNQSGKLEYKIGMFGSTCFITKDGKRPLYMELTDHSRAFELDGMMFKHIDFQSHIHFRCDKKRVNQAILVASLLFTPPMTSEYAG